MSRPTTKDELLHLAEKNFSQLMLLVANLSEEELQHEFEIPSLNRNRRDVLMHLHHWHLLFEQWYTIGMQGGKPVMPAEGYTWKTTPQLNIAIHQMYQHTPGISVIELLQSSHQLLLDIIGKHSNEQLFQKKFYKWTGSTSLGSYIISATSSHYDWAIKFLKKRVIK